MYWLAGFWVRATPACRPMPQYASLVSSSLQRSTGKPFSRHMPQRPCVVAKARFSAWRAASSSGKSSAVIASQGFPAALAWARAASKPATSSALRRWIQEVSRRASSVVQPRGVVSVIGLSPVGVDVGQSRQPLPQEKATRFGFPIKEI